MHGKSAFLWHSNAFLVSSLTNSRDFSQSEVSIQISLNSRRSSKHFAKYRNTGSTAEVFHLFSAVMMVVSSVFRNSSKVGRPPSKNECKHLGIPSRASDMYASGLPGDRKRVV